MCLTNWRAGKEAVNKDIHSPPTRLSLMGNYMRLCFVWARMCVCAFRGRKGAGEVLCPDRRRIPVGWIACNLCDSINTNIHITKPHLCTFVWAEWHCVCDMLHNSKAIGLWISQLLAWMCFHLRWERQNFLSINYKKKILNACSRYFIKIP